MGMLEVPDLKVTYEVLPSIGATADIMCDNEERPDATKKLTMYAELFSILRRDHGAA